MSNRSSVLIFDFQHVLRFLGALELDFSSTLRILILVPIIDIGCIFGCRCDYFIIWKYRSSFQNLFEIYFEFQPFRKRCKEFLEFLQWLEIQIHLKASALSSPFCHEIEGRNAAARRFISHLRVKG